MSSSPTVLYFCGRCVGAGQLPVPCLPSTKLQTGWINVCCSVILAVATLDSRLVQRCDPWAWLHPWQHCPPHTFTLKVKMQQTQRRIQICTSSTCSSVLHCLTGPELTVKKNFVVIIRLFVLCPNISHCVRISLYIDLLAFQEENSIFQDAVSIRDYGSITKPPSEQWILPSPNTFNFFLSCPGAEIWECLVTKKDVKTGSAPSDSLLTAKN